MANWIVKAYKDGVVVEEFRLKNVGELEGLKQAQIELDERRCVPDDWTMKESK